MTLAFLGCQPEKHDRPRSPRRRPRARVRGARGPPAARAGRGAPAGSRPGLFAIEAESPGAVELQAEVESRLVAAGLYEPEKRDFWPHLTVARVRRSGGAGERRPAPPRQADARRDASRAASGAHSCSPFSVSGSLFTVRCSGRRARSTCPWPTLSCRSAGSGKAS